MKGVIEEDLMETRPLGKPKLRWEESVKKDFMKIESEIRWREAAEDRVR